MAPTLVLVHTIPALVDLFDAWCQELVPELRALHIVDEPMLDRIRQRGHGALEDDERLAGHVALAVAIGAAGVLVTCSTVSQAVSRVQDRFDVPVLAIDDPMAAEAVRIGRHVAVIATAPSTLEPSLAALEAAAVKADRRVEISFRVVDHALPALLVGDGATHDQLVEWAVLESSRQADVVVLAQATMARVLVAMADRPAPVPVLASPFMALAEVRRALLPGVPPKAAPLHHEVRT